MDVRRVERAVLGSPCVRDFVVAAFAREGGTCWLGMMVVLGLVGWHVKGFEDADLRKTTPKTKFVISCVRQAAQGRTGRGRSGFRARYKLGEGYSTLELSVDITQYVNEVTGTWLVVVETVQFRRKRVLLIE